MHIYWYLSTYRLVYFIFDQEHSNKLDSNFLKLDSKLLTFLLMTTAFFGTRHVCRDFPYPR